MAKLYVSNKDESARLFDSNFLEVFTHVHFSVPLFVYLPVVTYMLWLAVQAAVPVMTILGLFLFGLLIWTLTEYLLHRFVFHYEPSSNLGKKLHFLLHGVHHDYPNDSLRLVMPPSVSIPLAILFFGFFRLFLGDVFVTPFFAGFIVGYLFYDMLHYATHHAPMKSKFGLWLKHHHMRHHYQSNKLGYGVS
ncbi:MAG: sterol desaturase family protein, partial [Ignavibacteria bacterium]|nr:sterol desaturase family protein [Ignavibacteria bacterium]